jgi:hypothetical protein
MINMLATSCASCKLPAPARGPKHTALPFVACGGVNVALVCSACGIHQGSAGGAIFAAGSSLHLMGSRLTRNSAWGTAGCAVMVQAPTAATFVHSSQFSSNRCGKADSGDSQSNLGDSEGGGEGWCESGGASLAVLTKSSWLNKPFSMTQQSCAAMNVTAGAVFVLDSSFSSDVASQYATGGSVCFAGTMVLMKHTSFLKTAAVSGGGLAAFGSLVLLSETSFHQLTAEGGGAAYTDYSNVFLLKGTAFNNCSAQSAAGGIQMQNFLVSLLDGVVFNSCRAYSRGGSVQFYLADSIYNDPDIYGNTFLHDVVVKSSAAEIGGAISTLQDDSIANGVINMELDGCEIEDCQVWLCREQETSCPAVHS